MVPNYFQTYVFCKKEDGHHSLIRWRVVVHSGIDGVSRRITCLSGSTNNSIQIRQLQKSTEYPAEFDQIKVFSLSIHDITSGFGARPHSRFISP